MEYATRVNVVWFLGENYISGHKNQIPDEYEMLSLACFVDYHFIPLCILYKRTMMNENRKLPAYYFSHLGNVYELIDAGVFTQNIRDTLYRHKLTLQSGFKYLDKNGSRRLSQTSPTS
jgi:hypothetical protein